MRFIGLDLGTKTLGISLSDRTNTIASPYKTITFKSECYEAIIPELKKIIAEKDITEIVLGLPKNMNNSCGFAAERSKKFQKLLESSVNLPIHLVDERLSSMEAEKILISTDLSRIKRKKVVDNVASAIILDTYLKERRIKNERESQES
jgi:putative Holliday junction resolvase